MERRIITVFCLIDEYLKISGIKEDVRATVSNAEILLIGYIAVSDFAGNYKKAHTYFWMIRCCKMLEYSRFIRRINEIGVYILRHDIAFEFDLSKRAKNKLTEKAFLVVIVSILAILFYLYIKEFYFVLSLVLSIFIVYFLYWIGLLDMIIYKLSR